MATSAVSSRKRAEERSRQPRNPAPPGVISLMELYTLEEARARLRWSDSALRAAKRRGLKLLACGKRRYIAGQEILRFLQSQQTESAR
jgi:hypothetical protein